MTDVRTVSLTSSAAGISRIRTQGGANPQTLYDLENGYVGPSKAPRSRYGTTYKQTMPAHTKGLMAFNGQLHVFISGATGNVTSYTYPAIPVFSSLVQVTTGGTLIPGSYGYRVTAINAAGDEGLPFTEHVLVIASGTTNQAFLTWATVSGAVSYNVYGRTVGNETFLANVGTNSYSDTGSAIPNATPPPTQHFYVIDVLRHPDSTYGATGQLRKIWFASPFLGYPYVVAEWDNGDIYHYWLRNPQAWLATQQYHVGDIVQPTTPNGFYYQAMSGTNPVAWAPGIKRASGDKVQPTTPNNFLYTVTATSGTNPASGSFEPTWPAVDTATITEFTEADAPPDTPAAPPAPAPDPTNGNYGNPSDPTSTGGGGGGGHRYPTRTF